MTIWTIGHSTRSLHEFTSLLRAEEIAVLADVRVMPGSRRYPHFNQDQLDSALKQHGIFYRHFPGLGGRRKPSPDSRNTAWRHPAFRAFADYMESALFQQAVTELSSLAMEKRTAIMCSEAVWWRCHRSLVADYFKAQGWTVLHILQAGKIQEHPFTSAARMVDGKLSYEPVENVQELKFE